MIADNQPPNPLPPILTQTITSEPRDIAIAIRIRPDSIQSSSEATQLDISEEKQEAEWEAIEDTFVELGMEVIDELATEGEGEKCDVFEMIFSATTMDKC